MIKYINNLENYTPENDYSIFIKQYFLPIIKDWTKKYIKNIDVEIKILEVNWTLIPISIWNSKNNCYTTSLSGTFRYLLTESNNINNYFLKKIINFLASVFLF